LHYEGASSKPSPRDAGSDMPGETVLSSRAKVMPTRSGQHFAGRFQPSPNNANRVRGQHPSRCGATQHQQVPRRVEGLKARVLWAWVWRLPSTRPPVQRAISTSVSAAAAPGAGFSLFGWLQVREAQSSAERPRRRAPLEHGPANKQCCDANANLLPYATLARRARRASER
jgi:hypothetical protein